MLFEILEQFLLIFFPETLLLSYPTLFDTLKIVFLTFFLIFIFFGMASLAKRK